VVWFDGSLSVGSFVFVSGELILALDLMAKPLRNIGEI
jgi:hypothetical protein